MRQYRAMFPRTALVTGAASGIGAAPVAELRADGADVQELDVVHGFDASDPGAWDGVEPVELACLNAGVTTGASDLTAVNEQAYRRILGANVDGVVYGVRRLAEVMEPGGAVVVTASLAGLVPAPQDPLYALTKHAVIGFVRSVASQLAERGIRINAVAPGIVDTPLIGDAARERFRTQRFPLLQPEEVARAVLLAANSEETGQVWALQPGRDPVQFRFANVPGPRDASGEPVGPPPPFT